MGKKFFQKSYRSIEFLEDYTLEELCAAMNDIYQTKFKCRISDGRIVVDKKVFSDGYPFNFGHLASSMINANSTLIEGESEQMKFTIGLTWFNQFSIFGSLLLLIFVVLAAALSEEIEMALIVTAFITLSLIWTKVLYRFGMKNFLRNWDHFIGGRV